MMEITKENLKRAQVLDKHSPKHLKNGFVKTIFKESKFAMYLLGAVGIFSIANATLLYSFYKLLIKL